MRFVAEAPIPFPPWSASTKQLINVVQHGISSHMYSEALPADLEEVFAHVSHELRTPFHGVMGSLEMLKDGMVTMGLEQRMTIVDSAIECGNSIMSTLSDILDIAKDRNNTKLNCTTFAAWTPILETMSAMNQFATRKTIELSKKVEQTVGELAVTGDERRIKHIVQNLVNNAIKFTPTGGKVEVSPRVRCPGKGAGLVGRAGRPVRK
ncbi:unnamed protein product [Ectocarpus sp. CCAP 1310/34]|nr:unnamed protein product [Ectocarpus sp. CCAP 1310/34]